MNFEIMNFETGLSFERFERPVYGPPRGAVTPAPQIVKDFAGPPAECAAALRRAGKTKAQALAIINTQIAVGVKLLRKAAADLQRGKRTQATSDLFLKIFRVRPGFVPKWLKTTANIRDRGDVVRVRCERVADLLASGRIKFFCKITATNCPECGSDNTPFACSSFGKLRVICLGLGFWDDMRAGRVTSMVSTLMHEPFHIYFGREVTEHRDSAGKFGGINCILQFIFESNRRIAPPRVLKACSEMAVRQELEFEYEHEYE
jgi:hypothetical protein